jgi:WD40 repeat protein
MLSILPKRSSIRDEQLYVTVDEQAYLKCDAQSSLQTIACRFVCRIGYYAFSRCLLIDEQRSVCACSTTPTLPLPTKTLTSTKETTTTTTSTTTSITETQKIASIMTGHNNTVRCLTVLNDGSIASGAADWSIIIWDMSTGRPKRILKGHTSAITGLITLPHGDIASASYDALVKVWNSETGTLKKNLTGHMLGINTMLMINHEDFATASSDRTIKVWSSTTFYIKKIIITPYAIDSLAALHNGRLLSAGGGSDDNIRIWDVETSELVRKISTNSSRVWCLAVLANSGHLVNSYILNRNVSIQIWNAANGALERTLYGHTADLYSFISLANGYLISGSQDNSIRIWDPNSGTLIRSVDGHTNAVRALVVQKNGYLVSASADRTVRIWNIQF